jgi:hypothetical protein
LQWLHDRLHQVTTQDHLNALEPFQHELNVTFDGLGHDDEKDAYRLTYEELIAPLIRAVQEIDKRLKDVEDKLAE